MIILILVQYILRIRFDAVFNSKILYHEIETSITINPHNVIELFIIIRAATITARTEGVLWALVSRHMI